MHLARALEIAPFELGGVEREAPLEAEHLEVIGLHHRQNWTDSPQPHEPLTFGLLNLKPCPIMLVTKSSSVPWK